MRGITYKVIALAMQVLVHGLMAHTIKNEDASAFVHIQKVRSPSTKAERFSGENALRGQALLSKYHYYRCELGKKRN